LPTDRSSYIRINLKGREPSGIVEPARYDALLNRLESAFRALVNSQTGKRAVEEVFRVREIFPGTCSDDLPDIVVLWSAEAPINSVTLPELGVVEHQIREIRSGNHRAEGFLLARGPNFIEEPKKSNAHILQIAPTILHLHGVAIPEQYEMAPLFDILR